MDPLAKDFNNKLTLDDNEEKLFKQRFMSFFKTKVDSDKYKQMKTIVRSLSKDEITRLINERLENKN
jgi:hypothetical protein